MHLVKYSNSKAKTKNSKIRKNDLQNHTLLRLKLSGVTVKRSSGGVDIFARRIVSGAGVKNTFRFMLPREVAQKNR